MKYHLSIIFISLIALYLFAAVIRYIRGRLILRVSKKIDVRLMISYFYRVIDLPIEGVRQRLTGEYLSRFSDIEEIRNAISGVATTLVLDTLMVVAAGVILFLENTTMFLTSLIMIFIYAIIVLCFRKPIKTVNRKAMEDNAVVRSYLKESFDGVETIKAFGAEQGIKDKATGKYNAFLDSVEKAQTVTVAQNTLSDATEMVGTVIILWIGFALVIANKMTVGALLSFYALLEYFTAPIKNLIELQPQMETAFVAIDRLNDILDQESENINQGEAVMPDMSTWELKDVDFRYGNRELVLHNVSISVSKGQRIALVGESGSGKTTIAKLLLKFYDPEAGKIEVGGKPISDLDARLLRSGIAYVDQNPFFFADTIRNNLMLGNPDATEKEMINACKQAAIHDYVLSLPTGYETPIFENGSDLSGGQRQRLAIARALLRKPQLLIFDEATSNLDSITENAIKESIFNASRDVSCIMIAHRLSTIRQCDKIYVMDKGTVAESGSHEELMDKKGLYYNMWISSQT